MATFITLINWTETGAKNFKDTVSRSQAAEGMLAKYGASFKSIYWTMGPYDLVAVIEAPDEESATAALLQVGTLGTVKTMSMRAFTAEEMAAVIARTD